MSDEMPGKWRWKRKEAPDPDLLDVRQAAEMLNVSTWQVRKWIKDGVLVGVMLGERMTRVTRESIERLIASRMAAAPGGEA